MKKYFPFLIVAAIVVVFASTPTKPQTPSDPNPSPSSDLNSPQSDEVHLHAGFQVYQNNTLQDFSGFKYMHLAPCSEEDIEHEEDEQEEKAHLHNNIGDVVHVHRLNARWKDLFTNLNYPLGTISAAFVNGQAVENVLDQPIGAYDSLVIFIGENNDIETKVSQAVTQEHITGVENTVESCGK